MSMSEEIFANLDDNSKDNDKIIVEVIIGEGRGAQRLYTLMRGHDNALNFAHFIEKNHMGSAFFRHPEEFGEDLSFADPWGFHKLKY